MTDAPSDSSAVAPPSEEAPLLTNQLRPHSDAVLTVRIIKSFEFRTTKNLILHHVNLEQMTVGELKELAIQGWFGRYWGEREKGELMSLFWGMKRSRKGRGGNLFGRFSRVSFLDSE